MEIKTAFIDLDNTLLNKVKKIPKKNLAVLKDFNNMNGNIVLATGRWVVSTLKFNQQINLFTNKTNQYVITLNGSYVYDCVNQKIIYQKTIDFKVFNQIIAFIEKLTISAWIYNMNAITNKIIYTIKVPIKKFFSFFNAGKVIKYIHNPNTDPFVFKILLTSITKKTMEKVINYLKTNFNDKLHVVILQKTAIEITAKDVSKGNGIKQLQKILNFDLNTSVAIGDSSNDLSMFKVTKYKICVNKKNQMLSLNANYVDFNKNGFANLFQKYVLDFKPIRFNLTYNNILIDLSNYFNVMEKNVIYDFKYLLAYLNQYLNITTISYLPIWYLKNLLKPFYININWLKINPYYSEFNINQINTLKQYLLSKDLFPKVLIISYSNNHTTLVYKNKTQLKLFLKQYQIIKQTIDQIINVKSFDIEKQINQKINCVSILNLKAINFNNDFTIFKTKNLYHIYPFKAIKNNHFINISNYDKVFKINQNQNILNWLKQINDFLKTKIINMEVNYE